ATGLAFAAALMFDRFDSFQSRAAADQHASGDDSATALQSTREGASKSASTTHLTTLPASALSSSGLLPLLSAELRLALQGLRWWWYAVGSGLLIAQFVAPVEASRGAILAVAWIWPALVWSAMGSREQKLGVRSVLFSCPRILPRQWFACWFAGFAVAMVTGAG